MGVTLGPDVVQGSHVDNVCDLLSRRAQQDADRVVLVDDAGDALTLAELDRYSQQLAAGLLSRGFSPGSAVLLLFRSHEWLEWAVAYFGVLRAGGVAILAPATDATLVQRAMDVCRPTLTLVGGDGAPCNLKGTVSTGSLREAGWCEHPRASAPPRLSPTDDAQVLFTSGTTGQPKGVVATHANLAFGRSLPDPTDCWTTAVHCFPIGSNAAVASLLGTLARRQTLVTLSQFHPRRLLESIALHRASVVMLAPTMASWLTRARAETKGLDAVEELVLSGSAAAPKLLRELAARFPTARIRNVYTSTEAYPAKVQTLFDRSRPDSVGLPSGQSDVRIVDDSSREVGCGVVGDILLRSQAPQRRYIGHDGEGVFASDWTKTGDVGFRDEEGYLYVVGRADDIVNVAGHRVSTQEIEHVLLEHPSVQEVAVVGEPHGHLGTMLRAFVVVDEPVSDAQLNKFVTSRLARYKAPSEYRFVAELPTTSSGKVRKRAL